MEYKASAVINASPDRIWKILTDISAWPEWDPYCVKIEGQLVVGKKITVYTKLSPRAFPVKVVELSPNQRMVWQGGMPFGLFKGVRTYSLTPAGNGAVTFTNHEQFSGPMLKMIAKSMPDLTDAFNQFVAGLKSRAEALAA